MKLRTRAASAVGAFVLSTSLVAATAVPAQADVFDTVVEVGTVAVASVAGGGGAAAAASTAGVCATGVGCVVLGVAAAAVAGYALWQHHDGIIDFASSLFQPSVTRPCEALAPAGSPGACAPGTTTGPVDPENAGGQADTPVGTTSTHVVSPDMRLHPSDGTLWIQAVGSYAEAAFIQYGCTDSDGVAHHYSDDFAVPGGFWAFAIYDGDNWQNHGGQIWNYRGPENCISNGGTLDYYFQYSGYNPGGELAESYINPSYDFDQVDARTFVVCVNADGSTYDATWTGSTTQSAGQVVVPNCADFGGGQGTPSDMAVDLKPAGLPVKPVSAIGWHPNGDPLDYPDCKGGGGCTLSVVVDGETCTVGNASCVDWQALPETSVECQWGPYVVPTAWCESLKRSYEPGADGLPHNDTVFDPWPEWSASPTPSPSPTSSPSPSPTGTATTDPDPSPTPSPTGSAYTGPRSPTAEERDTLGGPKPEDAPGQSNCSLGWYSLLDGTIIYQATSCALAWAFVPQTTSLQAMFSEAHDAWDASKLGELVSAAADVPLAMWSWTQTPGACHSPTIHLPLGQISQDVEIVDACHEPIKGVAEKVRLVSTVILVIAGMVAVVNPLMDGLRMVRMPEVSGVESDGQGRLF